MCRPWASRNTSSLHGDFEELAMEPESLRRGDNPAGQERHHADRAVSRGRQRQGRRGKRGAACGAAAPAEDEYAGVVLPEIDPVSIHAGAIALAESDQKRLWMEAATSTMAIRRTCRISVATRTRGA